jgi:hypothetical protein
MLARALGLTALTVTLALAPLLGQPTIPQSLSNESVAQRTHLALAALDRYMETWNSRDPMRWAGSLHYPHVRPSPGEFAVSQTAEEYAKGVDFNQTLATGWHHSEWDSRRVLQVSAFKVHASGQWTRYRADGTPMLGSLITYIITFQEGRWGVLSRFAAGPAGLEAERAPAVQAAALGALRDYFTAWNRHDPDALAAAQHFPFVRLADGRVEVSATAAGFLRGEEPGRQRTWFETRLDRAEAVQVAAGGVNIAVAYSRRGRDGQVMSQYEAMALVTQRDGVWRVQALSTMGP